MKVIICGSGKVGLRVASQLLLNAENDITIIDYDAKRLADAQSLDLKTIHGLPSSPDILDIAGAKFADLIVCVTLSDEVNILTAHIASSVFAVKMKIVRVRSRVYISDRWFLQLYNGSALNIDHIIFPEIEIAQYIINRIENIGIEENISLYSQSYRMISLVLQDVFHNAKLMDIVQKMKNVNIEEFEIKFVKRGEKIHFNLDEDFVLHKWDKVFVLCEKNKVYDITRFLHGSVNSVKNVLICGGGEVGFNIAKLLEDEHLKVKLIEQNHERAKFLSNNLPNSLVIEGDMKNRDLIKECGAIDTIINVSGQDETNLLTTLIAKSLHINECFTLIDEYYYNDVFRYINLSNVINTRDVTISKILNCISQKYCESITTICDGTYNICEFVVKKSAEINGMECAKLNDYKTHILAIKHNGTAHIDTANFSQFTEGDVVVIATPFTNMQRFLRLIS